MSHSCDYFLGAALARTLDDTWSRQPGCNSSPIFKILLQNVVLDELHLMLRITERLEEGLIFDILKWDTVGNIIMHISSTVLMKNNTCKEYRI